jgi:hypothetical protein
MERTSLYSYFKVIGMGDEQELLNWCRQVWRRMFLARPDPKDTAESWSDSKSNCRMKLTKLFHHDHFIAHIQSEVLQVDVVFIRTSWHMSIAILKWPRRCVQQI